MFELSWDLFLSYIYRVVNFIIKNQISNPFFIDEIKKHLKNQESLIKLPVSLMNMIRFEPKTLQ